MSLRASDSLTQLWFPETLISPFSKSQRRNAWNAIQKDDPDMLFGEVLTSAELVLQAETGMWNPNKLAGIRNKSLLEVLATQQRGTPAHGQGPIRCLDRLMNMHMHIFSEDEISSTLGHANYCERPLAAQCIQWYIAAASRRQNVSNK